MGGNTEVARAIGILRVTVHEARSLKNVEKFGKSDPYVNVMLGGKMVAQTKVVDDKYVFFCLSCFVLSDNVVFNSFHSLISFHFISFHIF